jgi:hypothetical protein
MPTKKKPHKNSKGETVYGPYKGSEDNKGRPIVVIKKKDGRLTSETKARHEYESRNGKVAKGKEVDHKNNNHNDDSKGNLQVLSKGENVAKRNKAVARRSSVGNKAS